MLVSVQRFAPEVLDARRSFHGAFHPHLWIHVVEQVGCLDEALFPHLGSARPSAGRRLVGLSLAGHSLARFDEQSVANAPGHGIACEGRGTFRGRAESVGATSARSVNIDWDAAHFGEARTGRELVRVSSLAELTHRVDALVSAITRAWDAPTETREVAAQAASLLALLRAEGIAVPRVTPEDLSWQAPPELRATSRALDRTLSLTRAMPMLVDAEAAAGLSMRTIQRWLPRVRRAWGYDDDAIATAPDGFRAFRRRTQTARACLFMSRPGATTEGAARVLGFASPNALCRAFADAGLPSPGQVRGRLRALG